MKISISAAQGTGKTTLMNALREESMLKDNVFITEIVRSLISQGIKINKGADHDSQCRILEEHYKNTLRYDNFITDRSALDAFVYATWDYLKGNYTYEQHKVHESMFLDTVGMYDKFFYIPIEFEMSEDGVRDTDKQYQKEIADLYIKIANKYNIPFIGLTGTVNQRVKKFIEYYQDYE